MSGKMYFRDRECRREAYETLGGYNFFFPYGEDCSLGEIDDLEYMIELLEYSGFDMSKVLWKEEA